MEKKNHRKKRIRAAGVILVVTVGIVIFMMFFGNRIVKDSDSMMIHAMTSVSTTDMENGSLITNRGEEIEMTSLEHYNEKSDSTVFFTSDISSKSMIAIYEKLGGVLNGEHIAVKLSTGEPPASNYLDPNLIAPLVEQVDGTIVENNTAYGGRRSSTEMHYQVVEDHGFSQIADFVILDENGSVSLPVQGGTQLTENLVGVHFSEYSGYLVLSHFKGHAMAGFGGAIKNISIGMASQEGKCLIHTAGESHTSPWGGEQDPFTESMAEAGKSVVDGLEGKIVYINVMNRLSIDCDCDGNPSEPDLHNIGMLASTDPVALDQACVDLVYATSDNSRSLINRMESRNAVHVLEHGDEIGLGSREYRLEGTTEEESGDVDIQPTTPIPSGNDDIQLPTPTSSNSQQSRVDTSVKKGDIISKNGANYKILSKTKVSYVKNKKTKKTQIKIPACITISGKKYKVTEIGSRVFYKNKSLKKLRLVLMFPK